MESLRHLLILCCYGGMPYIDYGNAKHGINWRPEFSNTLDPTDWIAVDSSGSLLNASIHPELLRENPNLATLIPANADISLDSCDLYNLTFSSSADQNVFEMGHGSLKCRCPRSRFGSSCHLKLPKLRESLNSTMVEGTPLTENGNPFGVVLLMFMCLIVAMFAVFLMMRGCFCDCFGGFKSPFSSKDSEPLDPRAVNRCLEAARAYEQSQKSRYGDVRHPLISSVSEGTPYNPPVLDVGQFEVIPPPMRPRPSSPPPSYRSLNGSLEQIPTQTKL